MSAADSAGHPALRLVVTLGLPLLVALLILHQHIFTFVKHRTLAHASSVSMLQQALQDPDSQVRLTAVEAIAGVTASPDEITGLYLMALGDGDDDVSVHALAAVTGRALRPETLVAAAAKLLQEPGTAPRVTAARALLRYAPTHPQTVGLWLQLLLDPETEVRLQAERGLAQLGPADVTTESGRALVTALGSPKLYVRKKAAITLGQLGDAGAKATGPLIDLALRDREARRYALKSVVEIGAPAVKPLADAWEHNQGEVLEDLGLALGNLSEEARGLVPMVESYGAASDPLRRRSANNLLATLDSARAFSVFTRLADHADAGVRADALRALGRLGQAAAPALALIVKHVDDNDKQVRLAAIGALGSLGPTAISVKPRLEKLLNDPDGSIRSAAAGAINAITPPAMAGGPGRR